MKKQLSPSQEKKEMQRDGHYPDLLLVATGLARRCQHDPGAGCALCKKVTNLLNILD
jgi:hypothetical protein